MKKKIWSYCLMLAMVFLLVGTGSCIAANQVFKDAQAHWAKDYINQLSSLGYVLGNPDGTFKPDKSMTRAEFTSLLISCMGITPSDKTSRYFTDTAGDYWALAAINEAAKLGILEPKEYLNKSNNKSELVPEGAIKRSEACAMLVRALGKSATSAMTTFKDNDKVQLSMYRGYIKTAADLGLMSGYSNGNFEPFNDLPRGQACTVLYKFLAQQGKVPAIPTTSTVTSPVTTGTTGSIRYVSIGDDLYDTNTVPISFIVNYIEVPVKSMSINSSSINVNNTYTFEMDSDSNNPDIVINNIRYGIDKVTVSGDKLVVSSGYRKIFKFKAGDYGYNSDYVSLFVKSANQGYYLSDMGIIDEYKVKVGSQTYNLSTDKITIATNASGGSTGKRNFYDIKKIELTQQDTVMQLEATDSVLMEQLGISDIAAIFVDNTTIALNSINNLDFIIGGKKCALSEVTIDGTGNFCGGERDKVYPYNQVMMIVDDMQYKINMLNINKSKFIFYCDKGSSQEWVIVDGEYYNAADVKIIKGTSIYDLDQAMVVQRNLIRIDNRQYTLDSDFKCRVDNKIYTINEIHYNSTEQATVIDIGSLADTTLANQPLEVVFFQGNSRYQEGTNDVTIYTGSKWVTFDQIFISDSSHFTYQDTSYKLIEAKIKIDDKEFEVTDTSWHGKTQVLDIYIEEL
ncbi:MAG: S-layer homology domain-containing protein [Syntrophomonas sp.]|nr:S-layer homology domain-containing protein [Syntrophomonas sp.]